MNNSKLLYQSNRIGVMLEVTTWSAPAPRDAAFPDYRAQFVRVRVVVAVLCDDEKHDARCEDSFEERELRELVAEPIAVGLELALGVACTAPHGSAFGTDSNPQVHGIEQALLAFIDRNPDSFRTCVECQRANAEEAANAAGQSGAP